ncbi:MAG: DMT family transporter [Anaerolineaceae bacterium]
MQNKKGELLLLLTSLIWGSSFVSQRVAMQHMPPFTFTAARFLLGVLVLLPIYLTLKRAKRRNPSPMSVKPDLRTYRSAGLLCGGLLFIAVSFQQAGMQYTDSGKAGFISSMYVVLVPLLGYFIGKRVRKTVWLAVAFAVAGIYLLSFTSQLQIERGDLIILIGTVFWAAHILMLDRFLPLVDGLALAIMQFFTAGVLALAAALFLESPNLPGVQEGLWTILYSGIVVVGGGYTLQVLGQKSINPAIAALIMSMESVFAVLFGWLLLAERLNAREVAGCVLMFAAVSVAQLPGFRKQLPQKRAIQSYGADHEPNGE